MAKKKDRPLTQILQGLGDETLPGSDRKNKEALALNMWSLAVQGKVTFPDGRELKASVRDWKDAAQWLYNHCDGPFRPDDGPVDGISGALAGLSVAELRQRVSETASRLAEISAKQSFDETEDPPST